MRIIKLINISIESNSNKFYNMIQLDDNSFEATWGRVGSKPSSKIYPMRVFNTTIKEKKRKGYSDITSNATIIKIQENGFENLPEKVKELINLLNKYAKEAFKINYTVQINDISEHLLEQAQEIIDEINSILTLGTNYMTINTLILKLINKIPRKIKKVKDMMIGPINDMSDLEKVRDKMTTEQGLLDIVKGQLDTINKNSDSNSTDPNNKLITFLDKLGLDVNEVDSNEEQLLKDMMGSSVSRYIKAYKITNYKTQKDFDSEVNKSKNKTTKLLFHGSKSENWLNIIKQGLTLHPNATTTGKLYDNGIYFADIADKSLGYIDGGRWNSNNDKSHNWLAVYDVHVGNQMVWTDLPEAKDKYNKTPIHNYIKTTNFDSYLADKNIDRRYNLMRNEFIIYQDNKCTIKYLIEIK